MSSRNAAATMVQVRPEILRVPLWLQVAAAPFVGLFRVLRWLVLTPLLLAGLLHLAVLVAVGVAWGDVATLAVFTGSSVVITVGAAVWNRLHSVSFRRYAVAVVRGEWRRMTYYRRFWVDALETYKLTRTRNGKTITPRLMWVTSSGPVDRLRVKLLPGQLVTEWIEVSRNLAQFFDVEKIRVVSVIKNKRRRRQVIDVIAMRRDALIDPTAPIEHELDLDQADNVDLKALPVALSEDGWIWTLRLLGNHLLIAGETGSGKGSVIWSILKALGPAIRSGRVHVHGIDPKGGIELGFGKALFRRFVDGLGVEDRTDAYIAMLTELRDLMSVRLASMQGKSRLLVPSPEEPLHLILIDELAAVVAYVSDRKKADKINDLLSEILTQGRAPGVLVIGAVQEPVKKTVEMRGLFSIRIALRLAQANYVDMTLGEGARANGAECDRIDPLTPGVAYVIIEGRDEPGRIRFPYVDDDEIRELAHIYQPGQLDTAAEIYPFPSSVA